jgi:hypothetical protein
LYLLPVRRNHFLTILLNTEASFLAQFRLPVPDGEPPEGVAAFLSVEAKGVRQAQGLELPP